MSPYLKDNRLADVISAITTLGTYKFYKMDFAGWSDRITGTTTNAEYWKSVFTEHPEFFRLNSTGDRASLVWRRQKPKTFNVDTLSEILPKDVKNLNPQEALRYSRTPLAASEVASLIDTAIRLHEAALSRQESNRWLVTLITGFLGAVVGSSIGELIGLIRLATG
jgi:hypothetical protein